jgi:hypothetical protein
VVTAGSSTRCDLDLRTAGSVRVVGQLWIDGAAPEGATAALRPRGWAGDISAPELAASEMDANGAFALAVSRPGPAVLQVSVGRLALHRELELTFGETRCETLVRTGKLVVAGTAPRSKSGEVLRTATLRSRLPDGTQAVLRAWIQPLENGEEAVIEGAPAGAVELFHREGPWFDPLAEEVILGRVTIPAGGVARLELE